MLYPQKLTVKQLATLPPVQRHRGTDPPDIGIGQAITVSNQLTLGNTGR